MRGRKKVIRQQWEQPCWTCQRACGGCNWSSEGKPIPGWIAIPCRIEQNESCPDTFKILNCPEYLQDEPKKGRKQK